MINLQFRSPITWDYIDVLDMGRLHELPGQSMLSTAITDEQDPKLLTNPHFLDYL